MSHLDAYIEKCPGFAWEGAPQWQTTVVGLRNKRTRRNSRWSQPRWRFTVPLSGAEPAHYDQIRRMHAVCRGRKHFFRVRNWLHYKAEGWQFATGDGATQEFQLGELVTVDGISVLLEIHALSLDQDAPTPTVYVDGVATVATFNDRTGMVRFGTPPGLGAVLTWSGWFDYWVAFASDDLPALIATNSPKGRIADVVVELEEVEAPDEGFTT